MSDPLVIVTGVAGALGSRTATILTKAGWRVAGIELASTVPVDAAISHFEGGVDLSDPSVVSLAFDRIIRTCGPLSALVNIAGGFSWETVMDGSPDTWDRLWAMNVKSSLNACRAAIPAFGETGGAIVNVSAAATARAGAGMGAYTATKSGVSRLTEALAEELKPRRIRVNAVLPTIIDTATNRQDMPDADFSKWVQPEELARVIAFLISADASAVTGALLPVSGRI